LIQIVLKRDFICILFSSNLEIKAINEVVKVSILSTGRTQEIYEGDSLKLQDNSLKNIKAETQSTLSGVIELLRNG